MSNCTPYFICGFSAWSTMYLFFVDDGFLHILFVKAGMFRYRQFPPRKGGDWLAVTSLMQGPFSASSLMVIHHSLVLRVFLTCCSSLAGSNGRSVVALQLLLMVMILLLRNSPIARSIAIPQRGYQESPVECLDTAGAVQISCNSGFSSVPVLL